MLQHIRVTLSTIKSRDIGVGLETREEYDILSARSISLKKKVDGKLRIFLNRLPGDEVEETDINSLI